jgi:ABC-type phosphate transport system substrate-binding protein
MRLSYAKRAIYLLASAMQIAFCQGSYAEVSPRIDRDIPSYIAGDSLSGELAIAVTEAVKPLVQAWADELMRRYPELRIEVISERSHLSLPASMTQKTEIMAMSRRMTSTEIGNCLLEFGDKPIALPVAHHPQTVSVRNDNEPGYSIVPVKPLWVNAMASNGYVASVTRPGMSSPYAFRRSVYLYIAKRSQPNTTQTSAGLIRYALSREGQQLALDLGYVPLSLEEVRRVTSRWSSSQP